MLRHSLEATELRALSIPNSLHFLLGVELDIFACSVAAEGAPFTVKFPPLSAGFSKLLGVVAKRFGLTCIPAQDRCFITGTAKLPLLRYVDYIPGKLHVDEIFSRFNVKPLEQPLPMMEHEDLPNECGNTLRKFEAHAIPYAKFLETEFDENHSGLGHYYQIELGLQLATHAHLIGFGVRSGRDFEKTIRKFQGFSGWSKFDLRWENEVEKSTGIIVLPSVADAVELLEAYEDEDEGNEENRLPFTLEPVAPTTFAPYMEDSVIKKMRGSHWAQATQFWETPGAVSAERFSIVVTNFSERVGLNDIVKLFDKEKFVDATLFVDETPHRRRRLLIQLQDKDAAKDVLEMDARHYHGAPLRISVAPPYVDRSRYGIELASTKGSGKPPALLQSPALKGMNVSAKEFVPKFSPKLPNYKEPPAYPGGKPSGGKPPGYTESPSLPPAYGESPQMGSSSTGLPASAVPPPPPGYFQTPPAYAEASPPGYGQGAPPQGANGSFSQAPPPMYLPPQG